MKKEKDGLKDGFIDVKFESLETEKILLCSVIKKNGTIYLDITEDCNIFELQSYLKVISRVIENNMVDDFEDYDD